MPLVTRLILGLGLALCACASKELAVTSVDPATGTTSGQENVVVKGGGFQPGKTACTVRFGDKDGTNVTILSAERIQVTTPPHESGPVDVIVTFDDGRAFKLPGAFNFKVPDQNKARDMFLSGSKAEPEKK